MAKDLVPARTSVSGGLHPMVYAAIVTLVLWFVFSTGRSATTVTRSSCWQWWAVSS